MRIQESMFKPPPGPLQVLMIFFFVFVIAVKLVQFIYELICKGHKNGWLYPFLGVLVGFFWISFVSSFTGGLLAFLIILTIPIFIGLGFASHRLYKWRRGELLFNAMRERGYTVTDLVHLFADDDEGDEDEGYYYDYRTR